MYDEPFADASQIPTFLVSRLARQSVTVSLSGDGGDELFAGYPKYATTEAIWNWARACPLAVRRATARGITRVPPLAYDRGLDRLEPFMARFGASSVGEKYTAPQVCSPSAT
jgi:asparagine synthase (glutamine-hydrolysing)